MGTQYGLVTRVLMTAGCVLLLWNIATAGVMWNKRRRKGTLGLPRRPVDLRIQRVLGITAVVLVDRYLIRRNQRLRAVFGQR